MQLDRDPTPGLVIRSFRPGLLRVGDRDITSPVILSAPDLISPWAPPDLSELRIDHLASVLDQQPELILLGTGSCHRFPAPELAMHIMRQGVGLEVMDTAAACRTFNVLNAEGRRVSAALFLE
ncbi:MAG: Mth938-like domain-containing protein [Gammaproteobacteria bacterium]